MTRLAAERACAPHIGVVVPARNEEAHIGECLAALDLAGRTIGQPSGLRVGLPISPPIDIVVVLDSCVDGTWDAVSEASRNLSSRLHVVHTDEGRVGAARRVGVSHLLRLLGPGDHWLATTDADSVAPPEWFVRQLSYRAAGAAAVVGTVHVDDWEDRARLKPHFEDAYLADRAASAVARHQHQADGHRHVHGANLSFSAHAYLRSGGFLDVASDEDVALVESLRSAGEPVVWAGDLSVATSVRRTGRAPFGFATYLNQLGHTLEAVPATEPALEPST